MTYLAYIFDFIFRWVSIALLVIIFLTVFLIIGLTTFFVIKKPEPMFQKGWRYKCVKVENPTLKIGDHLLQFEPAIFTTLAYLQSDEQKEVTPENAFCKDANIPFVHAKSFVANKYENVYRASGGALPRGLTQIIVRPGSREDLDGNCFSWDEKNEHCTIYKAIPDTNLTVRYMLTTTPYSAHGKLITSEQYPYAYYPREEWDGVFQQVETYIQGLIVE